MGIVRILFPYSLVRSSKKDQFKFLAASKGEVFAMVPWGDKGT